MRADGTLPTPPSTIHHKHTPNRTLSPAAAPLPASEVPELGGMRLFPSFFFLRNDSAYSWPSYMAASLGMRWKWLNYPERSNYYNWVLYFFLQDWTFSVLWTRKKDKVGVDKNWSIFFFSYFFKNWAQQSYKCTFLLASASKKKKNGPLAPKRIYLKKKKIKFFFFSHKLKILFATEAASDALRDL